MSFELQRGVQAQMLGTRPVPYRLGRGAQALTRGLHPTLCGLKSHAQPMYIARCFGPDTYYSSFWAWLCGLGPILVKRQSS